MNIKELKKRRSGIISQLCKMSRNGWRDSKMSDYQPLEAELKQIDQTLKSRENRNS